MIMIIILNISITLTIIMFIIMTVMSQTGIMTKEIHLGMTIFLLLLILSKKKPWWMTKILWKLLGKALSISGRMKMSSFVTEEAKANVMLFWLRQPLWRLRPQLVPRNYTNAK